MTREKIVKKVLKLSHSKSGLKILQDKYGGPDTILKAINALTKKGGDKK